MLKQYDLEVEPIPSARFPKITAQIAARFPANQEHVFLEFFPG